MEAKIIILGMSPRLAYLKNEISDYFSISFLYEDNIIKIEDLENYINKETPINIPIINNNPENQINFYLIRNTTNIIGFGEIPLVNNVKWFNLIEFNNKKMIYKNINPKIMEDLNIHNINKEKDPSTSSSNNDTLFQEIINSYNIKFKFSIEIINYADNNNSKINMLQQSISLKGSADSNSNSISNTCTNSKTPKMNKNINLLSKNNNILLKNNNSCFKKIDIYSKNKTNNTTLFSSINNKLLRNQTEKKLINNTEKKERVFSFNDYYDINNNKTEVGGINPLESSEKNLLNLTNVKKDFKYNLFNKRKKIINTIEQLSNIDIKTNSTKLLNDINFPKNNLLNKKFKNKSNKKNKIKNNDLNKNLSEINIYKNEKLKLRENNLNNNSFKKIEDVIIDQNFKNEIKNDEFLGLTSNNTSIISSSYYSTKNKFYENKNNNEKNNFIFNLNNKIEDIILINFNNIKNEFFKLYNFDHIKNIKNNSLFLEFHSFIHKVIEFENNYQKKYKELYNNFINFQNYLELFQSLILNYNKLQNKLKYIKVYYSLKKEKNNIINPGFEYFKNSKKILVKNYEIPFWNQLVLDKNQSNNNLNKNNRTKNELIKIFLNICKNNQKYFNSLSKKCYNDIKNKYSKEQNNHVVKNLDKQYYSQNKNKNKILVHNTSCLQIQKYTTNNNFYATSLENNMKTPKSKIISKKSSNFKKKGLTIERNKLSSFFTNKTNTKKFKKSLENVKNSKK